MEIRNCKRCNRLFQYNGIKYCASCLMELDEMYKKVRDYLYEHPDATIIEVSEATGVEEKIILEFLREGRLELKEPSAVLTCERCGKPITMGRMCKECLVVLERDLKKGFNESARKVSDLKPDSRRIHVADYIIKKRGKE